MPSKNFLDPVSSVVPPSRPGPRDDILGSAHLSPHASVRFHLHLAVRGESLDIVSYPWSCDNGMHDLYMVKCHCMHVHAVDK